MASHTTLSRQLLWRVMGLGVLLAALSTLANGWVVYRDALARQQAQLRLVLTAYGPGLAKSVWELDEDAVRVQLSGLVNVPAVLSAEVLARDFTQGYAKPGAGAPPGEGMGEAPGRYLLLAPNGRDEIATWQIRLDDATLRQQVWADVRGFVAVVGAELLLQALLIFWLMRRYVSLPVLSLASHVQALGVDQLARPAPLPRLQRHNELHELALGITQLQHALQAQLVHRDQTAHELARQRDQLNALLDQQAQEFDGVLRSMADGAAVLNAEGRMLLRNPALQALMGMPGDALLDELDTEHWLAEPAWSEVRQPLLTSDGVTGLALHLRKQGGRLVPVEASLSVIERGKTGVPVRIQMVLRDSSARHEAEQVLITAREAALAATRAKSEFLANMSHEIRTPMNAILGLTELALRTELSPRQHDYLSKTHTAAHALLGVINDILDFSKIEAGKLELVHEPFRLDELLADVASLVAVQAQAKGLEFLLDTARDVPYSLMGDALRLRQVLVNLCNNAVKFTERGEVVVVTVQVGQQLNGRVPLQFAVRDTGIGMSEAETQRLFAPFMQGDASTTRKYGGTGLGLAICRQLVQLMGGELRVQSMVGQGSEFSFMVDVALGDPAAAPRIGTLPAAPQVLVIDDSPRAAHILANILTELGAQPLVALSAAEGVNTLLRQAASRPVDLVVVDWKMPGTDGFAAMEQIKALRLPKRPRLVLATAFGSEEVQLRVHTAHIDGYLSKPVNPGALRDLLAPWCEGMEATSGLISPDPGHSRASASRVSPDEVMNRIAGMRVLLVEDNPVNQQVAQELLADAHVNVTLAANGVQALARLAEGMFDAVLMDVQMPELDGYEATRRIRANAAWHSLPVIAMTAHAMARERQACLDAGMNDFITKPIDPAVLMATLSRSLQPSVTRSPIPQAVLGQANQAAALSDDWPAELPGISTHIGLAYCGGKQVLYRRLLTIFLKTWQSVLPQLEQALQAQDWAQAANIVHALKADAATIGANELADATRRLEVLIKAREHVQIDDALAVFKPACDTVLEGLRAQAMSA
jgi:two-component system sensor histidine kinase/response regulator